MCPRKRRRHNSGNYLRFDFLSSACSSTCSVSINRVDSVSKVARKNCSRAEVREKKRERQREREVSLGRESTCYACTRVSSMKERAKRKRKLHTVANGAIYQLRREEEKKHHCYMHLHKNLCLRECGSSFSLSS